MDKIELTKNIAKIVVGIGTTRIVKRIIQNNVESDGIVDDVTIGSASVVVGMMASGATGAYTDAFIDSIHETLKTVNQEVKPNEE